MTYPVGIPRSDYLQIYAFANLIHAIVFWQRTSTGDYQPLLLPVDEATWKDVNAVRAGNG